MTPADFLSRFGFEPQNDDLHRVTCATIGATGHQQCGICAEHGRPRFACGCLAFGEVDGWLRVVARDGSRLILATGPADGLLSRAEARRQPDGSIVLYATGEAHVTAAALAWLLVGPDPDVDTEAEQTQRAALRLLRRLWLAFPALDATDELRAAFAALPCPECHSIGWFHKMDCATGREEGRIQRVAEGAL